MNQLQLVGPYTLRSFGHDIPFNSEERSGYEYALDNLRGGLDLKLMFKNKLDNIISFSQRIFEL